MEELQARLDSKAPTDGCGRVLAGSIAVAAAPAAGALRPRG